MQRLWLVALAALSVAATEPAKAQVSDDVVKIGVLTDMSGPSSAADGPGSVAAAQMAVDDFGGTVLGKPIQIISADHQIKPDIAAGIARRWYDRRSSRPDCRRAGLGRGPCGAERRQRAANAC